MTTRLKSRKAPGCTRQSAASIATECPWLPRSRRLGAKFSEGLHPDPPGLKEKAGERTPSQLFWVIKNGINMTGMPSFAQAGVKDEDLWSIVAFVKKLPIISEADYKSWTATPPAPFAPSPTPAPAPTATPTPSK